MSCGTPLGYSRLNGKRRKYDCTPQFVFGAKVNGNCHTPSNKTSVKHRLAKKQENISNKENTEVFQADPNSMQEIFSSSGSSDPLGFANIFGNEEDRKSLTPRRPSCSTPVRNPSTRRDSIFGQPLRVKPKTPLKTNNTRVKRGITPQRRLSTNYQRSKTPISVTREARLSLGLSETVNTPMRSRPLDKSHSNSVDKRVIPSTVRPIALEPPSIAPSAAESPALKNSPETRNHLIWNELRSIQEEEQKLMDQLLSLQKRRESVLERI